jgi:hypothetical protein
VCCLPEKSGRQQIRLLDGFNAFDAYEIIYRTSEEYDTLNPHDPGNPFECDKTLHYEKRARNARKIHAQIILAGPKKVIIILVVPFLRLLAGFLRIDKAILITFLRIIRLIHDIEISYRRTGP